MAAKLLLLGALLPAVNAYIAAQPGSSRCITESWSHNEPTTSPVPWGIHELRARQEASTTVTYILTIAPDETCGYLSGSPGAAVTCENNQTCTWVANPRLGVLCGREAYVDCLPMREVLDPDTCGDVCQSNKYTLKCSQTDRPYCRTYLFPSSLTDFRCAATPVTRPQRVSFTYDGQDDPNFITSTLQDGTLTTPTPTPTTSPAESSLTSTTQPPVSTTSSNPESHQNSTNIGAIVGGAVGGFAILTILVLGVLYMRRQRRGAAAPAAIQPRTPANTQAQVITPEVKNVPPTSPMQFQSNWSPPPPQNPSPNTTSLVSPLSWDGNSVAPAYDIAEMAGPESHQRDLVHEVVGDVPGEKAKR